MITTDLWITSEQARRAMNISKQALHRQRIKGKIRGRLAGGVGPEYEFLLPALPVEAQERHWSSQNPLAAAPAGHSDADIYAAAPEHARRKADKYLQVITAAGALTGASLKRFVDEWNDHNPGNRTSYPRLLAARKQYREQGIAALLGKWGKRSCATTVPDDLYVYFKSLYLCDGAPSAVSCWKITLGYASKNSRNTAEVPSHAAFMRRLRKEVPEQAVYTARKGSAAANKRYGFFIKRDYSDLLAGECLVSDHAQLDVACVYKDRGREKIAYPWVTAWRDFKSGFWTAWDLHVEPPCSDHIFLTTYRTGVTHGIPLYMILDNSKDFRCKSFAGGRNHHKLDVDEAKMTSLTAALEITTIFAWPYNAQSKSIERDFLRNKEWFSKHSPLYRGGNVLERPEDHEKHKKSGAVMTIDELREILDGFIENVVALTPVSSGYRAGKCPREIWEEEYPQAIKRGKVRHVSKQALMLFCTQTSAVRQIGRRGFHDAELGVYYYDYWMEGQRGRKVYLRRDPQDVREAFVFDALNHSFINTAFLLPEVAAIAETEVSRRELKEQIRLKRMSDRLIKIASRPDLDIDFRERQNMLALGTNALNEIRGYVPRRIETSPRVHLTRMDEVAADAKRKKGANTADLSELAASLKEPEKPVLYVFESDMIDRKHAVNE